MRGATQFKHTNEPASDHDLEALKGKLGYSLPAAYEDFLRESDGAECGPNDIGGGFAQDF